VKKIARVKYIYCVNPILHGLFSSPYFTRGGGAICSSYKYSVGVVDHDLNFFFNHKLG